MISVKKGALAVAKGTGKTLEILNKASAKLEPLRAAPFIGESVADLQDVIAMLSDYYIGKYKKIPFAALMGALAILAYLVSPIDIIPDGVPVLGFIDDALIINVVIDLCIDRELVKYRKWRDMA